MQLKTPTKIVFGIMGLVVIAAIIFLTAWYPKLKKLSNKSASSTVNGPQIIVSTPLPKALISSPFQVRGQAQNTWFFEGSFPVKLLDSHGSVIANSQANATGDFTKPGLVDFASNLDFKTTSSTTGTIVFSNDNPSGLAKNQKQFTVTVSFPKSSKP